MGGTVVYGALAQVKKFMAGYAGLSFYWAWVFLSFNSMDLTGEGAGRSVLFVVHLVSSAAAIVAFVAVLLLYRVVVSAGVRRLGGLLIGAALLAGCGTLLYTLPVFSSSVAGVLVGAIVSGLTCSLLVLAWGVAYRGLGAREAVLFISLTFLGAAVLYFVVAQLPAVAASLAVSLFPLAAGLSVAKSLGCFTPEPSGESGDQAAAKSPISGASELRALTHTALSWRVLLGLGSALFAYGGLRIYFGAIDPSVFRDPLLMVLPIAVGAAIFFVYGFFLSRTSLNLGVLYRLALPLFALAYVLIALFGGNNTAGIFFLVSTGSALFEILTWALLVEITRTTHFSPLLVFIVGRTVVHLGIVAGGLAAFALIADFPLFALIALCALLVSVGFTFTDRDTTFLFEPPTTEELQAITGGAAGADGASAPEFAAAYGLSPRETEVFTLWITGHGSKYIQEKFVISPATVKTHVRHIYEKCAVHNRAELMCKLEESSSKDGGNALQ
ncbi:MAG: helix-turn-helix transcriptional regulator [Raoultibacter sp.]